MSECANEFANESVHMRVCVRCYSCGFVYTYACAKVRARACVCVRLRAFACAWRLASVLILVSNAVTSAAVTLASVTPRCD